MNASQVADHLEERFPSRFKPTTRLSTAQVLASTWTQSSYLAGEANKRRPLPVVNPVTAAFVLVLGYLCGVRAKMLLDSRRARMLDRAPAQVADLAAESPGRVAELQGGGLGGRDQLPRPADTPGGEGGS